MGVSENRLNPIFPMVLLIRQSLFFMAISLGRLTQHFQTNPNHHITHGESAPADPDLAAPVKFSEAFVGRAQLFGIGGV